MQLLLILTHIYWSLKPHMTEAWIYQDECTCWLVSYNQPQQLSYMVNMISYWHCSWVILVGEHYWSEHLRQCAGRSLLIKISVMSVAIFVWVFVKFLVNVFLSLVSRTTFEIKQLHLKYDYLYLMFESATCTSLSICWTKVHSIFIAYTLLLQFSWIHDKNCSDVNDNSKRVYTCEQQFQITLYIDKLECTAW